MIKLIFIATLFAFVSCGQSTDSKIVSDTTTINSTVEIGKPTDNALAFLNSYVDYCNSREESISVLEWVNSHKLTSNSFKAEYKRMMDEANQSDPEMGLDADPIIDAQDYPEKGFELESFDEGTNYLTLRGKDWTELKVTMKMVEEKGNWLVDGCGLVNIPVDKRALR